MKQDVLRQIEQIIGYEFTESKILNKAFTHSSSVDERILSNERLEFLGDSVLGLVISQILFEMFPNYMEGDLTKLKSSLVSRKTCADVINELGLHKFIKVGKGMINHQALSGSVAAGLLETVIAAIYIDGGFEPARDFILRNFESKIAICDAEQANGNYKSLLQQYAQQHFNLIPVYELLDEKGPDHNKCFELQVVIGKSHFKSAWGTNKKEAEQKAAFNALLELEIIEDNTAES